MSEALPDPFVYQARLQKVVDGDTLDIDLDVGYDRRQMNFRIRLLDIDTAEISGVRHDSQEYAAGMEQANYVYRFCEQGEDEYDGDWPFIFDSQGWQRGSFGRALGYLYRRSDGAELTVELLEEFGEDIRYSR